MASHFSRFCSLIAFGMAVTLTACGGSWDAEKMQLAVEVYDAPAEQLGASANAAVHYKNLFRTMPTFPEAMQTMDQICEVGLPSHYSHLENWVNSCATLMPRLQRVILKDDYRLRFSDLESTDRLDGFVQLTNLLLVDAALREHRGEYVEAIRQVLRTRRMANHLASDGSLQDLQVAHLIHNRSSHMARRLLPHLGERSLQETIVELETSQRLFNRVTRNPAQALERLANVRILEWLKPHAEDTRLERWGLPSISALGDEVHGIFQSWSQIAESPLQDLFRGEVTQSFLHRLDRADAFSRAYFAHTLPTADGSRSPSGLVRMKMHGAAAQVRDEMLQLQAAALIFHKIKRGWPDSIERLTGDIEACLGSLGKGLLDDFPARPEALRDPFSGQSYGLRQEDKNLILWSWGPDFSNDDGLEPWDGHTRGDLIVTLKP